MLGSAVKGALSDAPEPAGQLPFGEGVHLQTAPPVRERVDQVSVEEVHGEPAVSVDVVAVGDAGAVVGVAGVAHGADQAELAPSGCARSS